MPENAAEKQVQLGPLEKWKVDLPEGARVAVTGKIHYRPEVTGGQSQFGVNQVAPACYYFDANESNIRQLK